MKLSVIYQSAAPASASPYRVRDNQGGELDWANAFLDSQRLRQLSLRSLRIYAYDLLNFARWFEPQHRRLAEITESTIVDYVRHQLEQDPKPTPQTVNHRLGSTSRYMCRSIQARIWNSTLPPESPRKNTWTRWSPNRSRSSLSLQVGCQFITSVILEQPRKNSRT